MYFIIAPNTPNNAPPAMKPEAIRVPLWNRALFSVSSFERVLTKWATNPPTSKGVFNSWGRYIPRAKARGEILSAFNNNAITAPTRYRVQ